MGRFMITAMPFTGHVVPLTAVASALHDRGHDVRFYTGAAFRERVEASGARLVPWRAAPDFDENDLPATFPRLVGKKGFSQLLINVADLFMGTAAQQFEDLEDARTRSALRLRQPQGAEARIREGAHLVVRPGAGAFVVAAAGGDVAQHGGEAVDEVGHGCSFCSASGCAGDRWAPPR